jgi:RNA polymerase sigma-70 factor (ECF subfamily)
MTKPGDPFPTTRWSLILASGAESPGPGLEELARSYWRPIHAWLAAHRRDPREDPADLAQDFFAWMIETGFVKRADPARGRFRAFLKTALRNFAIDRARRGRTERRGGGRVPVPLSGGDDEVGQEPPAPGPGPDELLDQAWRAELVGRALERLEQEMREAGREPGFRVFRDNYLAAGPDLDHAALAAAHGLTPHEVSRHLVHARRRFRAVVRQLVTETVTGHGELDEELRWLLEPERL